jgi:hypothetical protein
MKSTLVALTAAALFCAGGTGLAQAASDDMMGRHTMQGEVTRVDTKDGWVHVKTSEGTLIVHYPPSEVQNLKKGDMVKLELALKDNGPAPKK